MSIYEDAAAMLPAVEAEEGYEPHVYPDTELNATIGIGFCIKGGLSLYEARALAKAQIEWRLMQIEPRLPSYKNLTLNRKMVLAQIAFNCGVRGLFGFVNMVRALNSGDYDRAADEILDSDAGRKLKNRYIRLSEMMRDG